MKQRRINYLLKNLNHLSDEENKELDTWYNSFDGKVDDAHLLDLNKNPGKTKNRILSKISDQLALQSKTRRLTVMRIAASLALLFTVAATILWSIQSSDPSHRQIVAGIGEHREITLEDGTEVILNADSRLSYSGDFNQETRTVKLEGEAFFKVSKDKKRPFRVVTGDLTTTVLGTEFNVRAYRDEKSISVALAEGSVKLNCGNTEAILVPGSKAYYPLGSSEFQVEKFETSSEFGWLENQLVFNATPLGEVANTLKRKYGIQIKFKNKDYEDLEFTGKFKEEDISIVLTAIVRAHELKFQAIDSQTVEIY